MSSPFGGGRQPDRRQRKLLDNAEAFGAAHRDGQPAPMRHGPRPAVEFDRVTTTIGGRRALTEVSIEIRPTTLTVVTGLTGLGKTAFIEHLLARRLPDRGDVRLLGWSIRERPSDVTEGKRPVVGVVPRDAGLLSSRTVFENVATLLVNGAGMSPATINSVVNGLLEDLDLLEVADALPGELALGQRKIVALARALSLDPALIIFDEPEAGLDRVRARLMMDLIDSLKSEANTTTYAVITQDLPLACSVAEQLILFNHGFTVASGTVKALANSENPHVRALVQEADGLSAPGR